MGLMLLTEEIENCFDISQVIDALYNISMIDDDFNGTNGEEYLWDIARKKDFKTNQDYLCNNAKQFLQSAYSTLRNHTFLKTLDDVLYNFADMWLDGWATDIETKVIVDENNNVAKAIFVIAYSCED